MGEILRKTDCGRFAKFNGDEEKFALEWEPSFTDCGKLRCKIALHSFNEMNEAVLMATATVLDENGVETGKYNLCSDGLLSNLDVLEDFSEDSIEDFCENICLNALLPDYTFRDEAREVLNKAFMGVSLEFFANSSWEIEEQKNWREGLAMFLNPVSPLHVDGPQKNVSKALSAPWKIRPSRNGKPYTCFSPGSQILPNLNMILR